MATPELVITATLATSPVSQAAELSLLQFLVEMAVAHARKHGGVLTSGTVNLPAATAGASVAGTATWAYTANASS
jgi:hypothetical protein